MWKDLKYLIAYVAPLAAFLGVYYQGIWSFAGIYVGFILIPLFELFAPGKTEDEVERKNAEREKKLFFDLLLYLNIPILYGLILFYFYTLHTFELATYEIVGMTCSVGLIVGTVGINVAHELGHRHNWFDQLMSKFLLMSGLYMHFNIEHNRGHHKNVGTEADPATARFNESIYAFWLRSVTGSYLNAWKLEKERLAKKGKGFISLENEMIWFQVIQLAYLGLVVWMYGWSMLGYAIAIAVFGFLMLECVNYIEHYGLMRKKLDSGRYEKVTPKHSWNSNHELGRIFLYELTRHSDHHFKSTRKYQVLRHYDESPQLPLGYPASIILSLVPPIWFRVMNKRVKSVTSS